MESGYGKGSAFTVVIPQGVESEELFSEAKDQDGKTNTADIIRFSLENARILVVDDIPANLKVAIGLLSPYRAKVDTCISGAKAIELVKQQKYDLVFMDHMMPEMDGIEATARIRALGKQVPIVALTANAVVGMREVFLEKGFNDFLAKPIDVVRMDEILDKWIPKEKNTQHDSNSK